MQSDRSKRKCPVSKADSEIKNDVMAELKRQFKPEFLNRVDDIIVFHKLAKDDIKQIAARLLKNVSKLLESREITVEFTDAAIEKIADEGFDDVYGARPLKRAIQTKIEDALSEGLLDGKIKDGKHYICDVKKDDFTFDKTDID